MKYKVIKGPIHGLETSARVGDILTEIICDDERVLYKGQKAVCDVGSYYADHYCQPIEEE